MAGIRSAYRKLTKAKEVLPVVSGNAIEATKEEYIELNQEQMLRGEDRNAASLGQYKPPYGRYARMKNQLNALPGLGNKDYKLHGDYYKAMYLTVADGKITQGSNDEKAIWLEKNKDQRYGLQPASKATYIQKLKPVFNRLFLQNLK